ncbi:MAG: hypothetical protein QOJ16_1642 [Acidobacteriota bacterium]|jgi:hypothetical protein|nr:hypothetical protein [Acidobacteriota bacterium]
MTRWKPIAFVLFSLALLSALPAFAGGAPNPPAAAPSGCQAALAAGAGASLFDDLAPQSAALETTLPAWLDLGPQGVAATTVFHGFCHCTCSRIPDCNTNADCSNKRCLGGITCC